jgi:hypothetical protein
LVVNDILFLTIHKFGGFVDGSFFFEDGGGEDHGDKDEEGEDDVADYFVDFVDEEEGEGEEDEADL